MKFPTLPSSNESMGIAVVPGQSPYPVPRRKTAPGRAGSHPGIVKGDWDGVRDAQSGRNRTILSPAGPRYH
jgi:hypothetical protein